MLQAQPTLDRDGELGDHFPSPRRDYRCAEQLAVLLVDQLDEAILIVFDDGAAGPFHLPARHTHRWPVLLTRLRLAQANMGHFGIGEGGPGYQHGYTRTAAG